MSMTLKCYIISAMIAALPVSANAESRWHMNQEGGITWRVNKGDSSHYDHVEMSGKNISVVLRYGVDDDGKFVLNKSLVWPMLRTVPNNTHASLMRRYDWNPLDAVTVNGHSLSGEKVDEISLKGNLLVKSEFDRGYYGKYELIRDYFPSADLPALVEAYSIVNKGDRPLSVEIGNSRFTAKTDPSAGVTGSFIITGGVGSSGCYLVEPGDTVSFSASISAVKDGDAVVEVDLKSEKGKRSGLVDRWMNSLVLETPDPIIDRMFAFSKIRACESIFDTQGGPMHGPGGESYYAAIWANDQAEYINPYFPFTGYDYGNASALNSFNHFARFMNDEMEPIPSSIIAEGLDIWNGVGDRGDAAMIAHGASRYALASGDAVVARELWPLIEWCLDYCKGRLNKEGVVESDTDELENRFESGDANLCTSSLYYDALISAYYLARELGAGNGKKYKKEAETLRNNIEKYFGKNVGGFDTYAYYAGNDRLRAWICIPLAMGIDERAPQTVDALFSNKLWTENGLLTEEGDKTFWDRSTLYALRGAYTVGETKRATDFLHDYSETRLLGEHVPYAIEAWPEGSQRHLSAESGLYGRIITEGLFGIRPTGLHSFTLTPRLPEKWNHMSLRNIRAFGKDFDIEVRRVKGDKIAIKVTDGSKISEYNVKSGKPVSVAL